MSEHFCEIEHLIHKSSRYFFLSEINAFKKVSQTACKEKCNLLIDGYGSWIGEQWRPYQTGRCSDDSFVNSFSIIQTLFLGLPSSDNG